MSGVLETVKHAYPSYRPDARYACTRNGHSSCLRVRTVLQMVKDLNCTPKVRLTCDEDCYDLKGVQSCAE
ncbi:hypothetical protein PHLCEN_2v11967 [Hermanssonia centrifuga]|uniref:Uncharacterized protein n=1 Tax=Hermanssonia centrifuga TaxID=98765 RepID=A0A2R6NIF3_9APHY|nr:hypothetical protein PHLCEN_2v11967 [Hermanssonia centrifuga]